MKITTLTVRFGSTVNLGNFNSARFDVEASAQLEEGDAPEDVAQALHTFCRDEARRQALPIIQRQKEKLAEVLNHLPEQLQADILQHHNGA